MRTRTSILSLALRSIIMTVAVMGTLWAQTTGKIAGRVVDSATGDPLPGANVLVEGTALGAATDANGDYFIIAVPPGTYSVRAQVIGYAAVVQSEVRVLLNLTTTADFGMSVEAIAGEEVRVVAVRPVVQPDVSANVANVSAIEIEDVPVAGVSEFINLQAGIEPGMRIRGGGTDQMAFVVDGATMRDGRSNEPFSAVSFTAMSEIQIQTGGFNAEYGNVRSGVINVITKDPSASRYSADVLVRYSPAHELYFGDGPGLDNPDAYYIRPFLDPDVAFVGTEAEGVWDKYTQWQYPVFQGWDNVASSAKDDDDVTNPATFYNNLTAEEYQEVFEYHHRKDFTTEDPEYDVDLTLGGPVIPGLSSSLGNLRFLFSYRKTQDPYIFPMERTSNIQETIQGKLLADIGTNMKLQISALQGTNSGQAYEAYRIVEYTDPIWGGVFSYPWGAGWNQNVLWANQDYMFGWGTRCISDLTRQQLGATFTHALSPSTFYRLSATQMKSKYRTHPFYHRAELKYDEDGVLLTPERVKKEYTINVDSSGNRVSAAEADFSGKYQLDEAPYGWTSAGSSSPGSGLRLGGHWARARDTSNIAITTVKFDLTNQTNSWSQLKAGMELNLYNFDMNYSSDDSVIVHLERSKARWERNTMQAAFYVQEKLEFKGMIANLGLRLDYFSPGEDWWNHTMFDQRLINANYRNREDLFEDETQAALFGDEPGIKKLDAQVAVSPRIGVSYPITAESKLYFNYGHFRDIPEQRQLFQIQTRWQGAVMEIGNPEIPLLKTVSYELGYEHSLLDQYLLRVSGYYHDRSNQPNDVEHWSVDDEVWYLRWESLHYGDVRGLELTLNKTVGKYMRGFVNYTYMIEKNGNFGFLEQHESPIDMASYQRTTEDHYQDKPVTNPFGHFNIDFFAPPDFGPSLAGLYPLGDWRLDLLGSWRAGMAFTWNGPGGAAISGLADNVRIKSYYNLDIRLSKNFETGIGRAQFFMDINNVLNLKHMYLYPGGYPPFAGDSPSDWDYYMMSLHLPKETWEEFDQPYLHPYGEDQPGEKRKDGVAFVPIESAKDFESLPDFVLDAEAGTYEFLESDRRVLGWAEDEDKYYEFNKTTHAWGAADGSFVDEVLEDKAYIDMPNETYRTYLNPRSIMFGLRVWF
ncbi:MAG: TonB-dependent receptor [Fidelibacterota bacterium]|nr:MAG: TonB-dependent receptor [Candidatus Neomarinimicrobiota bacterium]